METPSRRTCAGMVGLNPGFRATLIPAMVVFALMAGCLLGLPDPTVAARESGIFRWDRRAEGRRASPVWGLLVLTPYLAGALLL